LVAAKNLSLKNGIPLITDLRDIIEQYTGNEFIDSKISNISFLNDFIATQFKKKLLRLRNETLNKSDYVTTVSEWHVEILQQYNDHVRLIYNGFDSDLFYPKKIISNQFKITYTGKIISLLMRDPSLLFSAVAELSKNGIIDSDLFRIQFYTDERSKEMILSSANKYGITDFIDFFDYVTVDKIPDILNDSSVLLLLTNESSNDGPKGVMTTKFFEYLAVEKPILCVKNDGALLEKAIRNTKAGISARTQEEVIEFLIEKYNEWKSNGYTHIESDKEKIRQYSRDFQAKQFISVFESVISE
jgi:glycosyltransferase involved in cell wall biosynthesis